MAKLFDLRCEECGLAFQVKRYRRDSARYCSRRCSNVAGRTHGKHKTRTYQAWANAKYRCRNPAAPAWDSYGARGITFAAEWDEFETFLEDLGECPHGLSLDRIDNNKGYGPGNCRWTSCGEQNRNRRDNRWIEFAGETKTLTDWARDRGMALNTLKNRMDRHGWSVAKALTTPVRPKRGSKWTREA
jgi:hypothetical protein